MKALLIACLFADGISSFQMATYNEIHAELAEDCAIEVERTASVEGDACGRYFDFRASSADLRAMNRQWLPSAELSPEQLADTLHFVERGNRAMRYIVQRSADLELRSAGSTE